MIVIGITNSGEQLRFELWAFNDCRRGLCTDPLILDCYNRCVRFDTDFPIPGIN